MERSASRTVLLTGLGALLLCTATATLAAMAWQLTPLPPQDWFGSALFKGWVRWDAGWYAHIATVGYSYTPGQQSPVAFFPAYPLAVRAVSGLGLNTNLSGVLIGMTCGISALFVFSRWARTRADEEVARDAGLVLALYPLAFFLYGAMYSDALFLLLVVSAFLMLERGHLVPAVLLGAVATAARPVAPALVLGLLARRLEWKRERGLKWSLWDLLPVLAATGFILYVLYQWRAFGEPFAFVKVQGSPGWDQQPGWRTWLKLRWFQGFGWHMRLPVFWRLTGHALVTVGALALVWPTYKRLGWGYGLYTLAIVGMPAMATKDFMSMGRYLLAAFPLFLTLAMLLRERPRVHRAVLVFSAALMVVLAGAFGAGAYVT
ncbi:hypothetical protein DRW03_33180 [Corallococcus sp. H22C18031201]|nr:hypothetical protein DRW03_33180 [Corallococcus sp. H22C18031201]